MYSKVRSWVTEIVIRRNQRGFMPTPAPRALALRANGVAYPAEAKHISAVRADLRVLLSDCPMADDVILCASELAANAAVIHSHSAPARRHLHRPGQDRPRTLRMDRDRGQGWPLDPSYERSQPIPRARHHPCPRGRLGHRRRPHHPHHMGPIRLARPPAIRRAPVGGVRTFFTVIKGARSAPGPTGHRSWISATRRMALTQRRRSSRRSQSGPFGERCAPGRLVPLLGPPGHGGVGARVLPAARRTGQAPQRSAPGARAARAGAILPALQCEAGHRSPARALRVTRDGLRPPLRLIFPGLGLAPIGRTAQSGASEGVS